jgi:NAD-dependent DNA ligase
MGYPLSMVLSISHLQTTPAEQTVKQIPVRIDHVLVVLVKGLQGSLIPQTMESERSRRNDPSKRRRPLTCPVCRRNQQTDQHNGNQQQQQLPSCYLSHHHRKQLRQFSHRPLMPKTQTKQRQIRRACDERRVRVSVDRGLNARTIFINNPRTGDVLNLAINRRDDYMKPRRMQLL